jgi:uncharacterized protein YbjQ (UPF0145 family)
MHGGNTMKRHIYIGIVLVACFLASPVIAADVLERYSIAEAMNLEKVKALFGDDIAVSKTYGTFKTSKRTNAFGKTHVDACAWAMASALVGLRDRAAREGGNAVINIVSNIKNVEESSQTDFTCLAGSVMVNVALKGKVVYLEK